MGDEPATGGGGEPITREDLERLIQTINGLPRKVSNLVLDLRRLRIRTWIAITVGFVALVALIIAAWFVRDGRQQADRAHSDALAAERALESFEANVEQSRIGTCIQENVQTERTREALTGSILALAPDAMGDPDLLTPQQRAVYDAYATNVARALPYRDCTPDGIAAYLENPPPDPATSTSVTPTTGDSP